MDVYHIFDTSTGRWSWRNLSKQDATRKIIQHQLINSIGCVDTDTWVVAHYGVFGYKYARPIRVYDQYGRIIQLSEIREWVKTPPPEVKRKPNYWYRRCKQLQFTYRYDPVPGISHSRYYSYWKSVRKNKRAYVQSLEYAATRRRAKHRALMFTWSDDHPKHIEKNWKHHSKKSKQWM